MRPLLRFGKVHRQLTVAAKIVQRLTAFFETKNDRAAQRKMTGSRREIGRAIRISRRDQIDRRSDVEDARFDDPKPALILHIASLDEGALLRLPNRGQSPENLLVWSTNATKVNLHSGST